MIDPIQAVVVAALIFLAGFASSLMTASVIKDECSTFGKTKIAGTVFVCTKAAAEIGAKP